MRGGLPHGISLPSRGACACAELTCRAAQFRQHLYRELCKKLIGDICKHVPMSQTEPPATRAQSSERGRPLQPDSLSQHTTAGLRRLLGERNLPATGNRQRLVARLQTALRATVDQDSEKSEIDTSAKSEKNTSTKSGKNTSAPSESNTSATVTTSDHTADPQPARGTNPTTADGESHDDDDTSGDDDTSAEDNEGSLSPSFHPSSSEADSSDTETPDARGKEKATEERVRQRGTPRKMDGVRQRGTPKTSKGHTYHAVDRQRGTPKHRDGAQTHGGDRQRGTSAGTSRASKGDHRHGPSKRKDVALTSDGDRQRGTSAGTSRASKGTHHHGSSKRKDAAHTSSKSRHHGGGHHLPRRHHKSRKPSRSPSSTPSGKQTYTQVASRSSDHSRSPRRSRGKRHRTSPSPSPSSSGDSSGSPSSTSSGSTSRSGSSTSTDRGRRHRHKRRRRHRSRHHRRPSPTSCLHTVPGRLKRKIGRGEYVKLYRLLAPPNTPPLPSGAPPPKRKRHTAPRRVIDFATWLEAWNTFLRVRVAHNPTEALALVKYQSHVTMLFAHYPSEACIEYDQLFRQAAARDPQAQWDRFQPDVFVWAMTPRGSAPVPPTTQPPSQPSARSFRTDTQQTQDPNTAANRDRIPIAARLGPIPRSRTRPPRQTNCSHTAAGKEICKRFNWGRCSLPDCAFAHTCWVPGCNGAHPATGCPKRPSQ